MRATNIFSRINQLISCKDILKSLTIKNFKTKYIGSTMGITWPIITPLLMAVVINFIFTKILKVEIDNFTFFVLSGFLPWMFFSKTLSDSTNSIINNVNLLNQFSLPIEIIPLSYLLTNFISFLIGFIVILPIFIFFSTEIILYIWFLPVVLIFFLLFTSGICLFLASINVFFRDTGHILEIILLFWFWMTPIFYSIEMVPLPYRIICYLNPLTFYIIMFRDLLYEANLPNIMFIIISVILAFIVQILGYMFFVKVSPKFLKRI